MKSFETVASGSTLSRHRPRWRFFSQKTGAVVSGG
jgi:hypothetical protein